MMILLRLNKKYNRDDVMSLRQKAEKIKEIKQGMRKAALVGLASLVTTTALGEENKNNFGGDAKKNQTEIPAVSPAEKSSECACYVNNLTLDAQSPICQIYKVSRHMAFYSHYLNGGAGGIVFTRFHISDADAFGNANQTGPEKFSKALQDFASRAKNFGYKDEIKNLDDVARCLASYADSNRKKDRYIGEALSQNYADSGLQAARTLKETVADLNEANLKMAKHEQTHASNGQYMKAVNTGDILLSPGGIYLARMADELRAQIKGGNIQATAAGVENFFADFGAGYYEQYTSDILQDVSYNRMFAYALNEEQAERRIPAEINNSLLGFEMEGVDSRGRTHTINGVETSRGFVYFGGEDVSSVKMKNGRVLPLNCLADAEGRALKDGNGQKIPARVIYNDGDFTVALAGSVLTTKDMDRNLDEALRHILRDLTPSEQKTVLNALNAHCRDDADKLTNALLQDSDSLMKMRAESDNVAADLQYIREKRASFLQKAGEEKYAGMNLVQIASPQDNALQLTPAMFRQLSAERK